MMRNYEYITVNTFLTWDNFVRMRSTEEGQESCVELFNIPTLEGKLLLSFPFAAVLSSGISWPAEPLIFTDVWFFLQNTTLLVVSVIHV